MATAATSSAGGPAPTPTQKVELEPYMDNLAKKQDGDLQWRTSIVDFMKLLGMDSCLKNRQLLARDLKYNGDMSDTEKMNVWLLPALMQKIAANGCKVPDDLLKRTC